MQRWKEWTVAAAALASDAGLFGCLFYFFQLTRTARYVQVNFAAWFLGLCLICFIDNRILKRGCTVKTYMCWNIVFAIVFCGAAVFWYEADVKTFGSWFWYFGVLTGSLAHGAAIARRRPAVSTTLLYLDGTVAALAFLRLWEYFSAGGRTSGLGSYMMLCIGLNFLALMMTVLAEHNEGTNEAKLRDGIREGRFPVFVPVMFLVIVIIGAMFVVLGENISVSLVGAVIWIGKMLWKGVVSAGRAVMDFLMWVASFFQGSDQELSVLPEAVEAVIPSGAENSGITVNGMVIFTVLVIGGILAVLLIDGKRFLSQRLILTEKYSGSRIKRKRSRGLLRQLFHKIKEKVIFVYRYVFHPEDIRMLVTCAEYYGSRRHLGRSTGETLKCYFERLGQKAEISEEAARLSELSEQLFYGGKAPVITRREGKHLRKTFGLRGMRE